MWDYRIELDENWLILWNDIVNVKKDYNKGKAQGYII